MGGIRLQLLCGVILELALGSLPYPSNYRTRAINRRSRLVAAPLSI